MVKDPSDSKKEGKKLLFNDTLNTFYLRLYGIIPMVKDHSDSEREGKKLLFNDTLNTFYLRLYGIKPMLKDHSDSERENLLLPHGLLFQITSKGFHMHHPIERITHATAFVTPVVEHWLE